MVLVQVRFDNCLLKKNYDNLNVITMILFGENNDFKPLCLNSNFVEIEQTDDYVVFENI